MKSADGRFVFQDLDHDAVPDGTPEMEIHRFAYPCRTNPRELCSLNLRGRGHDIHKRSWIWDGNVDAPTIAPSINCEGCWHGFIEKGVFLTTDKKPEADQGSR